ncbi:uncharacterized protein [Lolium perenne]|uniref:uncharacterized protein isoform X1 n=1 Tax=Lolium perenne TaxID=4522 RepID=UPI0021F5A7F0|nr:uncharacterized protein LOC127317961 isoform X2 [Lolium perenne]
MMATRTGAAAAGDTGSPSARAAAMAGDEDAGLAKVKLLCSFAGRIAPRSGDGALRYVGGQMRLISLPRAASFGDLMRKVEAVDKTTSSAGGVLVKYQLPGEDLDSLVSVSCAEDYHNMLEEYEKLAAAAPDGSAKLRVFLFPASGTDSAAAAASDSAPVDEPGQRYIDAINCVSADAAAAFRRKDSVASAGSSPHNSEQGGVVLEGMSPRAVPPPPSVPPEYLYSAGSHSNNNHSAFPQSLGFISAVTAPAPAVGIPAQNPVLLRTEPSPLQPHQTASYAPPAQVASYVPQHQPAQVAAYAPQPQAASSYVPLQQPQVASYAPPPQAASYAPPPQLPQVTSYAPPPHLPQITSYTSQMPQPHMEPQQVQYINAQQLGQHGAPQSVNLMPVQTSQYAHTTLGMATAATQIGTSRPVYAGTEHVLENPHFTRPMQTPVDPSYRVPVSQPLSQLPPLLHMTLQASDAHTVGPQPVVTTTVSSPVSTSSGTYPMVVSSATVSAVRYDDCTMCQKILPHAHSDNMIKDQGNPRAANYPDATPVFYSLHQQNATNQHVPGASAATPGSYIPEPRAESKPGMAQFDQKLSARNPAVQATPSPAAGAMAQPTMVTVPVTSNGVFVGHPPYSRAEDNFTYQHPQQPIYIVQPSQVLANGVGGNPQRIDATAYKNSNHPVADPLRGYARDIPQDYPGAIDARMQGVNLGPIAPPESIVQGNSAIPHGAVGDRKIDNPPAIMDGGPVYKSQAGGYHVGINSAFPIPSFIPEDNTVRHTEQPPPPLNVAAQNVHPEIFQRPNMLPSVPVSNNLGVTIEQPVSSETFLVRPAYSGVQVPAGPPPAHTVEMLNHMVADPHTVSGQVALQATAGTDRVDPTREPACTESLFSNQDPWKALGAASIVPPRPNKLANGHIDSGYPYVEGHVPGITSSNVVTLLEEGNLSHIQDPTFKDIYPEPAQISKGYGEESIKRQLQAVAEGVAASVLQSSFPEKPTKSSGDHIDAHGAVVDPKIEDTLNKESDKTSQGVPILDDIDNLQIIKNSDLEELRELGSGTFGTVYHGKWRGSDVAIKRISDRCFVGKASEEQRMKTDFWNEACKLASLHHPNVVAFYGVVLDGPGGSVATVTEYMANGSLRQALQRHEKIFDRRRRLLIVMDVAFGMEYLHGKNIVHFDLKSDNLLVNLRDAQRPICKVGDLGLSKVKCQTLISGGVRGTLPWMAPELLNGSSNLVSEKVDVFSFGIVMWELITGEEPYADLHYGAIIGGIVNNNLRPPVPESCDPQWRSLMEQCWSAEPSERPSFTEVVKRLRAMATSPTKAQPQK